jgi:hypothetical protein
VFGVYGGGAAAGADVAAGVFAVTGGWAGDADEVGAAAGALPAVVVPVVVEVLVALLALFAPAAAGAAGAALSALAATAADFAAGAVAGADAAALAPVAGVFAAYALDGAANNARLLAQPSAHAARNAARHPLSDEAQIVDRRGARGGIGVFTTGFSTARYAPAAACRATPAPCTR